MDKFLAKKHAIFRDSKGKQLKVEKGFGFGLGLSDSQMRYKINSCILQLTLKSLYEMAHQQVFGQASYYQLQCDVFFLFQVCFGGSLVPSDHQVASGDIHFDILPVTVDENTPIYCGLFNEVMSSAMTRFISVDGKGPASMDETLLYTMAQVKKSMI